MVGFSSKKIVTTLSLGETLFQARQAKSMTLEQAARLIKVSADYLKILEEGSYERLPGEVYAKNFLKVYASFLGLDAKEMVSQYLSEKKIYSQTKKISPNRIDRPVEKIARIHFLATPKIIRNLIVVVLMITLLVYLGLKVKGIFAPPQLEIYSPTSNVVTTEKIIEISGQSEKETVLKINGQKVLIDSEGLFSETVALQSGTNLIEITAQKKHGQPVKIYRQVSVVEAGQ